MFKLNQYSDYFNNDDPNYPNGKAVDTTTAEGVDGTPLLAKWMNNVQGAFEAIYKKAFGDLNVSGKEDNSNASDILNAIEKIVDDGDTATLNAAKVDATNKANAKVSNTLGTSTSVAPSQAAVKTHTDDTTAVHGSTSAATANRIVQRDSAGRAKVAAPSANDDIARLDTVNNKVVNNNTGTSTSSAMSQSAAKSYTDSAKASAISTASEDATAKANAKVVNNNTGTSTTQAMSQQSAKDYSDGDILDTTTLSPKTNGAVRLTGSSATRTLSNGVFAGQEFTIINATGATKTISAATRGNSFQLTSTRIYTKLVWSGTTWLRGMEIPVGTTVWLLTNDNPDTIFGGDWNMVGVKDRALVSGNGTTGNSTGKLPQIDGGFNQANALNYTQGGYPDPYGAFGRETSSISGDVAAVSQFGKVTTFSANKSNSTKYSTSKTELIKADGTYVNGWTKVAF